MNALFEDAKTAPGHSRRALRNGAASIVARALNAAVQIGSVLFLARLLTPEDYGLVAMVMAIAGFAPVFVDLGTRDAIVQRDRITEGEISALFWVTFGVGCIFALVIAASGPSIARFYGDPRLTSIALVASLTFVATGLQCQHFALLRRRMMFQELAIIEVSANIIAAAVALALAFSGFGYWALVTRPVTSAFLLCIAVWGLSRWLPKRPTFTTGVRDMLKFGVNLVGFTMTDFLGKSGDRVAIGYRVGATGLGYYQNAMFVYDNLIDLVATPLHNVAIASLSKLRGDMSELRRLWAKALTMVTFFAMPLFGVLAVTSHDVIVLLLGSKWAGAGALLSILALRGIPHSVERTLGWLHVTAGRTDRWMRWGVFAATMQLLALAVGLPFGPTGIAVAFVVVMFVLCVPALVYAGRPLQIGTADIIRAVWRQMLASMLAVGVGFWLRQAVLADTGIVLRTALLSLAYMATYLGVVVGLLGVRTPLIAAFSIVREFLPIRVVEFIGMRRASTPAH